MKQYLIAMKSGEIQIITIINEGLGVEGEISKFSQEVQGGVNYHRSLGGSSVPSDRTFRDAWCDEQEGEQIDIRMSSAKEIALSRLRAKRDKKLEELDKQTVVALGANDEQLRLRVEGQKQELRDVTEPLKALVVSGYNDSVALAELQRLSFLGD